MQSRTLSGITSNSLCHELQTIKDPSINNGLEEDSTDLVAEFTRVLDQIARKISSVKNSMTFSFQSENLPIPPGDSQNTLLNKETLTQTSNEASTPEDKEIRTEKDNFQKPESKKSDSQNAAEPEHEDIENIKREEKASEKLEEDREPLEQETAPQNNKENSEIQIAIAKENNKFSSSENSIDDSDAEEALLCNLQQNEVLDDPTQVIKNPNLNTDEVETQLTQSAKIPATDLQNDVEELVLPSMEKEAVVSTSIESFDSLASEDKSIKGIIELKLQEVLNASNLPEEEDLALGTQTPNSGVLSSQSPDYQLFLSRLALGANVNADMQNATESETLSVLIKTPTIQTQLSVPANERSALKNERFDSAKNLRMTKPMESRTLEKVESVLKEVSKSKDGKQISVRLDPPQLGSVKIDLSYKDNTLYARFQSDNPSVNHLMREKTADLQAVLRKVGLDVEKIVINVAHDEAQFESSEFKTKDERHHYSQKRPQNKIVGQSVDDGIAVFTKIEDHWVA